MTPGEIPDIPSFLRVDAAEAARRASWWEANPPVPTKFIAKAKEPEPTYVPPPPVVKATPRKYVIERRDMTGFYWDPRRGRFIPDGYMPPRRITAKRSDEEIRLAEAQHARNEAPKAARVSAKVRAFAMQYGNPPAKVAKAAPSGRSAGSPGKLAEGETKIDCIVRLLRRPEGATLVECGEATGLAPHTVQARLADTVKRKLNHIVNRTEEPVGNVFRIEE